MFAVVVTHPGPAEGMVWQEVPDPVVGPGDVLIKTVAAGVNRADVLQRLGYYPPPKGTTDVLGLECSGRVIEVGAEVENVQVGDEVCALLTGGGYAELVAVPAGQVMPIPAGLDPVIAAGLPEVACTVWSNVIQEARLSEGEWFLVHGGSSGIGTHAIQLAKTIGAKVAVTAGSAEKLARCEELGADLLINYREQDFAATIFEQIGGVDVILDIMGAKYLQKNIASLNEDGRIVVIGMQGGTRAEIHLDQLLDRRATLYASSLRRRPVEQKAAICKGVTEQVWPLVTNGTIKPVIDTVLPIAQVVEAHKRMESSTHIGKIVLVTQAQ